MRCVNIDWLEVFCEEDLHEEHDADYYRRHGYVVLQREYGTPQYSEMFTLYICDFPFIEIRRKPYSIHRNGGIFKENACHIRLSNRTCYDVNPVFSLQRFLQVYNYKFVSISRIDICCDFNVFDNRMKPVKFIELYMSNKIAKMGLSNVAAYGKDSFYSKTYNSVKWGYKPVSVKLYNKSLEMKEKTRKLYIEDAWQDAGLNTNVAVWRIEFSLTSAIKVFVTKDSEFMYNVLATFNSRDKLIILFSSLVSKYFRIKKVQKKQDGTLQRKDRCEDVKLFNFRKDEESYIPRTLTIDENPSRIDKIVLNKLKEIVSKEKDKTYLIDCCDELIRYFTFAKRL